MFDLETSGILKIFNKGMRPLFIQFEANAEV